MIVKGIVDEDFVNYNKISMFIACHSCSFKCDKLSGRQVCQNGTLANSPDIEIPVENLADRYLNNSLSSAVVFGGLEPFDNIDDVIKFIDIVRKNGNNDDIVIYTGYTEEEITGNFQNYYSILQKYSNIIIKYGRFIPDQNPHFDHVLGVNLASNNQYAVKIS